jgi:VIT1/CCC1 family predicted Fe2+/Mn2+ transporter
LLDLLNVSRIAVSAHDHEGNTAVTMFDVLGARSDGHLGHRAGWLRAAVLGANDGLVSTSSLMVGVATASNAHSGAVLTAGLAGLAAGAMAMAAGEWVSVSSQADVEQADLDLERRHLAADPDGELEELTVIYQDRGLSRGLAEQVARELHQGDVLAAHARDELGQHDNTKARPIQAATASAASFTLGGLIPFLGMLGPYVGGTRILVIVAVTILGLTLAGYLGARAAGAGLLTPMLRVVLGGSAAMAITAGVGQLVGVAGL